MEVFAGLQFDLALNSASRQLQATSKRRLQPLAVQQAKQLQRRPAWVLFTTLPFPHGRQAGVQHDGQHGPAQLQTVTQRAGFFAVLLGYGLQAQRVELVYVAFVNEAEAMKINGRFVHCFQNRASGSDLKDFCHVKFPQGLCLRQQDQVQNLTGQTVLWQ